MINASTVGRLGQDAKEFSTSNGKQVVKFSMAVKMGRDETEWVNCALWGNRGQKLLPHLTKGTSVWVAGELSKNSYVSKDGENKTSIEINVQTFEFAGGKQQATEAPQHHEFAPKAGLEDIPF
jgi:single-strand DNA-binding protein